VTFLTPVWNYIDALVHPSAQRDALTAARHRAFIAPRLLGSFAALASFPVYIAFRSVPSVLELGVFGWLVAPILIACFLSRSGRYECAHMLSSLSLTGLVAVVAWCTGGISSFAAIWLVVVPLEAALSASRRVVALAATFALAAAGVLMVLNALALQPPAMTMASEHGVLAALSIISAVLYATGLALGAERLTRTSADLLNAEEERYRLLARYMSDGITQHGRNGAVLFASPAAETQFGVRGSELAGHGLFDRVQLADRPAYRTALVDAAALGEDCPVEFRIHRDYECTRPAVEPIQLVTERVRESVAAANMQARKSA
jgi:cell cycle sensor histidine kinase DivJ